MSLQWLKNIFKGKASEKELTLPKTEFRARKPEIDELSLGWAQGYDDEKDCEIGQLKGVKQKHRDTHFYVVGGSGTGKTKFLETLIR